MPASLRVRSSDGATVSFTSDGAGPPLVLVHGGFSDHESNWAFVRPLLRDHFRLLAVARRGRGGTDATTGHALEDEARDVAAVIEAAGEPVFLLGHSYGAHCSLLAAALVPDRVRKLVLYEPAWPQILPAEALARLEKLAASDAWDELALRFFGEVLCVPAAELETLQESEHWPPIVADAPATLGDLRALVRSGFDPERFRGLAVPVLLQVGSESPRELYATDALAAVLPGARIEALAGQAHEAMTTAPALYAESVRRFLLGGPPRT